ncbi:MAG TPA: hypothetical protein DCS97_01810 [Planctomycetes bacterium]|nr:hypothetical protein [Planctomycetota bacterium]
MYDSSAGVSMVAMTSLPELNFHHLRSFWVVAHQGTIAKACGVLHLSQPTISEQLRDLARALGAELFERDGRRLRLSDTGRRVLDYADEIFAIGRELHESLAGRASDRRIPLVVGVSDSVSKLIACRLIEPALRLAEPVQVTVQEDRHDTLLQRLADHELDLVLSDAPLEAHLRIRAFNHVLGESAMAIFGAPAYARLARGFPASLADAGGAARYGSAPRLGCMVHRSGSGRARGGAGAGQRPDEDHGPGRPWAVRRAGRHRRLDRSHLRPAPDRGHPRTTSAFLWHQPRPSAGQSRPAGDHRQRPRPVRLRVSPRPGVASRHAASDRGSRRRCV